MGHTARQNPYRPLPARSLRAPLVLAAVYALTFAALVSQLITSSRLAIAVDDIGQEIAALAAIVACLRARNRTVGRSHRGWSLLTTGMGIWASGQIVWITTEVVLRLQVPSPSAADIGFLAAVPFIAAGLVMVCFPSSRVPEILRTVLDALLIVTSLLIVAYVVALQDMIAASNTGLAGVAVSLVYPVGNAMLVTIVLVAISQSSGRARRHLLILLAGLACWTFSDSSYAMSTVAGTYRTGRVSDTGWTMAFLLIAVAAIGFADDSDRASDDFESGLQGAAPYLVLLATMGVVGVHFAMGGTSDSFIRWTALFACAIAAIGLILHRERWRRAEIRQAYDLTHDRLTDLPNMAVINRRLDESLASGGNSGVLYLDVDRLGAVNTSLGRAAGDELLCALASRLRGCLPASCTLGRVGSDEFVVIDRSQLGWGALHPSMRVSPTDRLIALAERINDALASPFILGGYPYTVSASIGVSSRREHHRHGDELIRESQEAMRRAKRGAPSRIETFDTQADRQWTLADVRMDDELRKALRSDDGLVAHFQPIVRLADMTIVGHEALVRWKQPDGWLMPAAFLPVAERTGLIVPLGWWMLNTCGQTIAASGDPEMWIAANVAGAQLGRGELVPALERTISLYGILPEQLHIEVTESQLVEATSAVRAEMHAVADMGVVIALDDFGTGYSSLTLLRDLPVGVVKIDRTFVSPLLEEQSARAIVRSVIHLCDDLGIDVVAEGVESQSQANVLRDLGCGHAQGFLFGAPDPGLQRYLRPRQNWISHGVLQ